MRASLSVIPCDSSAARRLQVALGLHRATAEVLVRRGFGDPAEARAFLEQEGALHDPLLLGAMPQACELIEAAIAGGRRIVVHGDYDVDGICATALAVETLRELGGDVAFHLPSRFAEGYGVAVETVDALADAGTGLLLTVDCGITAVEAVARARERGLDVVISDHHRPGEVLPDAPLVSSRGPDGARYLFPELCGTGVAFKIAQALWARRHGTPSTEIAPELARQLDLVALATVADVVELRDENRALVRAGMRRLARGERPGLRALMHAASVDRARLRSSDLGFRLAPRINAAGRLGHPGIALDLLLTRDGREADEHAAALEELNRERRGIEDSILRAAVDTIEEWPDERRAGRAYVVWGEGWHEGVIGIVASRLVDRYGRPTVVLAVDGDSARGSGRSVSAFDLHAGLHACQGHLQRWGGHRAAAGLSLESARVEAFARDFRAHADERRHAGRPAPLPSRGRRARGGGAVDRAGPRARPARAVRARQPGTQPAPAGVPAGSGRDDGRDRQAPAAAGGRRWRPLWRGGLRARLRGRGAACRRPLRRALPARAQRVERDGRATALPARRPAGPGGSRAGVPRRLRRRTGDRRRRARGPAAGQRPPGPDPSGTTPA